MTKKYAFKKGFTLAEVMIVLTVIGVLTAILLPVARQSMPDENLMKFKKAHNTLGTVIRELVTSDKYYLDGDLGVLPDGTLIDSKREENETTKENFIKYFCNTIAQVVNAKKIDCKTTENTATSAVHTATLSETAKIILDTSCKEAYEIGAEIEFDNDVVFYQTAPRVTFGYRSTTEHNLRTFGGNEIGLFKDENNFNTAYKIVCIDIDGIHPDATIDNCVNECPFGYGIRADGKILAGARAQEWLERDVNEE